jgi:hypothetical protein
VPFPLQIAPISAALSINVSRAGIIDSSSENVLPTYLVQSSQKKLLHLIYEELISSDQLKSQAVLFCPTLFLYPLNNLWLSDVHIFNTNVLAIYSI